MKIFQFTTGLSDGGAETLITNYSILLKEKNHIPIIVTLYKVKSSANHKRILDAGIREISVFGEHNFFTRVFRILFGKWYIPYKLRSIIKNEKPDCIHSHMQVLEYLENVGDSLAGINLFYTCHSMPDIYLPKGSRENIAAKKLIKKFNLRIIALHDEMKNQLNQLLSINNTIIIKNGIDFRKYIFNEKKRDDIRNELKINNEFVIGHIGRFNKVKNHEFIIEVFKEVLMIQKNAKLLLIGSGPLENEIKAKVNDLGIKSNVIFLSHRTDIPALLMGMDAFIFPSLYEGLSLTLVEAQKIGLRCVISDSINIENIMSNKTFMLNLDDNPIRWANVLIGENHNDFDEQIVDRMCQYDLNVVIDDLIALYLENGK